MILRPEAQTCQYCGNDVRYQRDDAQSGCGLNVA